MEHNRAQGNRTGAKATGAEPEWHDTLQEQPEDYPDAGFVDNGRLRMSTILAFTEGAIRLINRVMVRETGDPELDRFTTSGWIWTEASASNPPARWMSLPPAQDKAWTPVGSCMPEDDERNHFYDDGRLRMTTVLTLAGGKVYISNRFMVRSVGSKHLDGQATNGWEWGRDTAHLEVTHWMPVPCTD